MLHCRPFFITPPFGGSSGGGSSGGGGDRSSSDGATSGGPNRQQQVPRPSPQPVTLDPTVSSFLSRAGTSSDTSSKANKGKSKTAKPPLATTKEGISLEFAQIEINTIRTRLKDHENTIKDLKFQNSILLERLSVFEKSEKDAIYDQYFPKAPTQTAGQTTAPASCQTYCCLLKQHCCQSRCSSHPQPSSTSPESSTESLDTIVRTLAELKKDVNLLKSKLINQASTESLLPTPSDLLFEVSAAEVSEAPKTKEAPGDLAEADDSITTIDENVPDISSEESLNSSVLTTQLIQLGQEKPKLSQR